MATQKDLADHLGISQPAIAALVREGAIPVAHRGRYDLDACRLAYCARLREQAAGRLGNGGKLDLATERARLASAQAEAVERKNAIDRGELGNRHEFIAAGYTVLAFVTARLEQIPARVAMGDQKLRKRIEDAVNDALTDLSMTRINEQFTGDIATKEEED